MSQSRRHSAIEAVANVAVGYTVSIAAQIVIFPWFGIHIAFGSDLAIGGAFTAVSLIRSFALRRVFNAWHSSESARFAGTTQE